MLYVYEVTMNHVELPHCKSTYKVLAASGKQAAEFVKNSVEVIPPQCVKTHDYQYVAKKLGRANLPMFV